MGQKFVSLDAYVELGGTNYSDQFSKVAVMTDRPMLDSSVFGSRADSGEKGPFKNGLDLHGKPDLDMVFARQWATWYAADAHVAFKVRLKNSAKAVGNDEFTGFVHIDKIPWLGVERGKLLEGDSSLPGAGPFTMSDGTNPDIVFG